MNETSCFSPMPLPYRCHLFPWQPCFWWHCGYLNNTSIAWVHGGGSGRARLHTHPSCAFSPPCGSAVPRQASASFTSVPIVRADLGKSGNLLMAWVLGRRGGIQRQAWRIASASVDRLASGQYPANLFSYLTDYSRNVRSY